ncbi:MAG: cation diffusion facilitator family transporter [Thaumarchaeota archaeon]|nr:cation diffusion facilitator family transporter [Nitrososphaerota archaeon]MCL5317791.1 cation diffusion facilitator family transporter [Nitrososphaerota archaeon]
MSEHQQHQQHNPYVKKAEKIALLSAVIVGSIGFAELIIAQISGSLSLLADGIDGMSDASVTTIVWLGIRISRKKADSLFHYGYYRAENLSAFLIAIILAMVSGLTFYNAYLRFFSPTAIESPAIALATALISGTVSLILAFIKRSIAIKSNLLSLKAEATNAIKDGSASFVVFFSILGSFLGFTQMDSIGAMIVAVLIATVSITILKEATLILLDAWHNPEVVAVIKQMVEKVNGVRLKTVRLRQSGPYIVGEMIITVNPELTVAELTKLKEEIQETVRTKVEGLESLIISAEPHEDS